MSLNSPEIDAILGELPLSGSHIQKVIQRDFKNLYLSIYAPPEAWWLRICLEHPYVRVHSTTHPPRTKRSHQRFESFLHSRITGGRIESVEHMYRDRIVRFTIRRDDEYTYLYLRLWGTRANAIATETDGTVLDACFRKPKEGLESGGSFVPTDPKRDNSDREIRAIPPGVSINEAIDEAYHIAETERDRERLTQRLSTRLERTRRRLATRLGEIEKGQREADAGDRNRHYGDLILANLYRISPSDEAVDVEDYLNDNAPLRIPLDPRLDGSANAKRYYDRGRRAEESTEFLASSAASLKQRLRTIDDQLSTLREYSLSELRSLLAEVEHERSRSPSPNDDTPGIEFDSQGFRIVVGRNAKENDKLLRGRVKGNDWWLHTRDYAGGYVFIRNRPGKSVPLEVLLDAGNLALFYSKGRSNGKGDLYYTQVKYLRRAKDGPTGLVIPTQEKNLQVELDPERLKRLGIGSSI